MALVGLQAKTTDQSAHNERGKRVAKKISSKKICRKKNDSLPSEGSTSCCSFFFVPIQDVRTTPYFDTYLYRVKGTLHCSGCIADASRETASFFLQWSFRSVPYHHTPCTRLSLSSMDPFYLCPQNRTCVVVSGSAMMAGSSSTVKAPHLQMLFSFPLCGKYLQTRSICLRWRSFPSSGSAERLKMVLGRIVVGAAPVTVADREGVAVETQNHEEET